MESYTCLVGLYLDGGPLYWLPPLGGVVLSTLCGVGMMSDRAEGTAIPSVLAGLVRRHDLVRAGVLGGLDLSRLFQGVRTVRGH